MYRYFYAIFASLVISASQAFACDTCALNTSLEAENIASGAFHIGLTEQYTRYGSLQKNGKHLENEFGQYMTGSITQIFAEYGYNDNFAVHASLPYINRRYKTVEEGEMKKGVESGIGDLSLIAKYVPYRYHKDGLKIITQLFGGIKLPTGDSDLLKEQGHSSDEEDDLNHHDEDQHTNHKHAGHDHEVVGAVHGHDVALGSGSIDLPLGANALMVWRRALLSGNIEYLIRNKGDHGYEYADHLKWSSGVGYYLSLSDSHSITLRALLSGEYKKRDHVYDELEDSTGQRVVYLGPSLSATIGENFKGDIELAMPIETATTGTQAVADYRVRAGITFVF